MVKLHAYISSDGRIETWKCKEKRGNSIRIRDYLRVRFFNGCEEIISDYINCVKKAFPHLTYIRYIKERFEVDIRSQLLGKALLKLGNVSTPNWEFPRDLSLKQKTLWIKSFVDCDGTVYNKNYHRYIAIDSINQKGLKQISKVLKYFAIDNKVYTIKYKDNISYRIRIYGKENLIEYKK